MSKEHILVVYINRIFHDLTASDYDKQHPEIFLLERGRIRRLFERFFGNEKFPKVIDIGSGTGFIYETVKDILKYGDFYMLDISKSMLMVSKDRHPECIYINGSALRLPFKNETFDLVILNSVLHHLPDIPSAMKEIYRILKHNGKVLINHEPNLRFSRNTVLWIHHILSMWFIKLASPIRWLKSIIANLRGVRNPVYDKINERLLEEGIIDQPLKYEEISAYIDYFSPTAGYIRKGRGLDP